MRNARLFRGTIIFICGIFFVRADAQSISWSKVNGPYSGAIQLLTVDPSGNVFAATSVGMYRSTDKGGSWQALGFSLEFGADALGVDSSGNVYAGNITEGLYESSDKGTSWFRTNLNGEAFAAISGNRICAGGWTTVSISDDNGKTWFSSQVPSDYRVPVLSIAEDNTGNVYAGLEAYPASQISPARGGGIYISSDSGKTWKRYGMSLISVSSIIADREQEKVFISTGRSILSAAPKDSNWINDADGIPASAAILTLQSDQMGEVIAVTNNGLFVYNDSTGNWKEVAPKVSLAPMTTAFYNPNNITYAGTERDGIYFLDSTKSEWLQCGISPVSVTVIGFDGLGNLFAGVPGGVYEYPASVGRWLRVSDGLGRGDRNKIYYSSVSKRLYLSSSDGLFYLPDGGNSWIPSIEVWAYDYVEIPDLNYEYIGSTGGIFRAYYDVWSSSTPTIGLSTSRIYCLALDASDNLYAGTQYNGVFMSTNGGTYWTQTDISSPFIFYSVKAIAIDAEGRIFAGTDTAGTYYSDNSGENWEKIPSMNEGNVTCFLVNHSSEYFAGTSDHGVFVSTDHGSSWQSANNGLTDSSVAALMFDQQGYLYAATNSGLFKSSSSITAVIHQTKEQPASFSLLQNYPNPFNPLTNIRYSISSSQKITLTVYDLLGREVATLVNELKSPGTYKAQFDGSKYASGTYFYRLTAGNYVEIKKMVLLK